MDSITAIATNSHKIIKPDTSAKISIQIPPPTRHYVFNVLFDNDLHDMKSLFYKAAYRVNNSIGALSNFLIAIESVLNIGAGPNMINEAFLRPAWKGSVKSIQPPQLETA